MRRQSENGILSRTGVLGSALLATLLGATAAQAHEEGAGEETGHTLDQVLEGIHLDGGMTWVLQASDGNSGGDATDLTYTLDLSLTGKVSDTGSVNIALEAGDGAGIDAQLGSLSTANYDAFITELSTADNAFNSFSISQAYYEGEYWDGTLVVDFGKLDVHSLYDDNAYANDETDQFLSAIFTRTPGTVYAELDQYYAPGIALMYGISDAVDATLILANGVNSGFNEFTDKMYGVAQVHFKPEIAGYEGNYRFYVIDDTRAYTDADSGDQTSNTAWGVSFDQALPGNLGVFVRYSTQDDKIVENSVESSWSLGAVVAGGGWGRPEDVAGIGYGSVNVNTDPAALAASGITNPDDETHLELYYKFGISRHFTLTPDVQVIGNNGGSADSETVTVYGVRAQLNF